MANSARPFPPTEQTNSMTIAVVFNQPPSTCRFEAVHGRVVEAVDRADRWLVTLADVQVARGAFATRVTVHHDASGFTFFLRDVGIESPMIVPSLGVAVVPATDPRSYAQIEAERVARRLQSTADLIDEQPEETYEAACQATRRQRCPTWLGLGRDMRIFRTMANLDGGDGSLGYWGWVQPCDHSDEVRIDGIADPLRLSFALGRGAGCRIAIRRWLEDGSLPILRSSQVDGDVEYDVTAFATMECGPITAERLEGTHPVAALANTWGAMLTDAEKTEYEAIKDAEVLHRGEELICWVRAVAINHGDVPRYAYLRAAEWERHSHFGDRGWTVLDGGAVIATHRVDGVPMPQREMAILLQPGQSFTFDLLIPHRPLTPERATALADQSFSDHWTAARSFWQQKLAKGASISVPEPAIDERIRAGLLHLDVNTLGRASEGHLLTTVGWYAPIGSESAPMIQFYDSMGWHEEAERSIQFFLDRQRSDGFIETFGGYQLETGPALWTLGEHFRYTGDIAWAERVKAKALLACDYILAWRKRNCREELRGKGYGLLDGKVADPEDFFHSFMLNGLAYLGLKRVAEMLREIDPKASTKLTTETEAFLADIRTAYSENVARSPVVPLGDGTWAPSFGPWAEYPGPVSLYAEGGDWFSHGAVACRDTLIGSLYLGIGEVLDPKEPMAHWLLQVHQELMTDRNAGFSQPYYCRHDWLHLKRGEVKPYLKTYYNQMAALQDRETYTFWEHYYTVSQHKTHEEGWFLMQTRWMLWDEDNDAQTLRLLPMIPRTWLADGKEIVLENCRSIFGPFSLSVRSEATKGRIVAAASFDRRPSTVTIRLPHPDGKTPTRIEGGCYDPASETVEMDGNEVILEF